MSTPELDQLSAIIQGIVELERDDELHNCVARLVAAAVAMDAALEADGPYLRAQYRLRAAVKPFLPDPPAV